MVSEVYVFSFFSFYLNIAVRMEVYRLLRADEIPEDGLSAKAPNYPSSVVRHVAHGSYSQSRFISACGSQAYAIRFRAKNRQNGFPNGPIVKINIDDGMTFYDLRTYGQRQQILVSENVNRPQDTIDRFHSFAEAFQEVLIEDHVPAENIVVLNV